MNWLTDLLEHQESAENEEFKEWKKSAPEFLHDYYLTKLDGTHLTECDPCGLLEDGKCVYLLEGNCMLDGLQHITKKEQKNDNHN